jgi:hypothetical protein
MTITDVLNLLFLRVVELVRIAVNHLYIHIHKLIFGKIIGGFKLACRKAKPGYD